MADRQNESGRTYPMGYRQLAGLLIDRCLKNVYIALGVFLLCGALALWLSYVLPSHWPPYASYALRCVGGSFFSAGLITIVARLFVLRHYDAFENSLQEFVRTGIESSLDSLKQYVISSMEWVKHLNKCNVSNVYPSRREAARDMRTDITLRETSIIQIAGISLNDFVRAGSDLHHVWTTIVKYINKKMPPIKKDLAVQLLIVHPDCLGAELRSLGELRREKTGAAIAGRLRKDVRITAELLADLEDQSRRILAEQKDGGPRVTFEARLYSLAPMFFLFRTDNASYIQQYYFWSSREAEQNASMPVMRYSVGEAGDVNSIHRQMGDHFEWIWRTASVPVVAYLRESHTGYDKGLVRANCLNVYNSTSDSRGRILSLLNDAGAAVDILGVSLKSFFNEPFFNALKQAMRRKNVESIRILIIDRHCEQAAYRSYREYLLDRNEPQLTFEEYKQSGKHKESELWRDTQASLLKIKNNFANLSKLKVKLYHCAPTCFVLVAGSSVLVEQYHYGKAISRERSGDQGVLGKDMPVYEYTKDPLIELEDGRLYPVPTENTDEVTDLVGRAPYQLVRDHFDHIWNHYSREFDPDRDL